MYTKEITQCCSKFRLVMNLGTNKMSMCNVVNSIYCSITVNHRLTGPGKMVKLCLLFVGKFQIQKFDG
jgi:hypothetical protein